MKTLIINVGSRWIKCAVFGSGGKMDNVKIETGNKTEFKDWLASVGKIDKVGIRIVHGGGLRSPTLLDTNAINLIKKFSTFAPLHNTVALHTISLIKNVFVDVPIYGIFDTYFHRSLPEKAYTYPIPHNLADKYEIRKYGFHGIAFESCIHQLEEKVGYVPKKLIMLHLGGGSSAAAVLDGKCIDTTMGMTPLDGLMMITRSGSIDPDIPRIICEAEDKSITEVSEILNKKSGIMGIVGNTDTKQIFDNAVLSNKYPDKLAFDMYLDRIIKQIFAYYGLMQGADSVVISGGIGFQNKHIRPKIIEKISIIGIMEDAVHSFEADEIGVMNKYIALNS